MGKKNFQIRALTNQLLTKYQFFTKLPQYDILMKIVIFKVSLEFFLDQMLLPYKFHGRNM